jgi:hypothetical protein
MGIVVTDVCIHPPGLDASSFVYLIEKFLEASLQVSLFYHKQ